jgi:trk system potassium uptake protein TrkH
MSFLVMFLMAMGKKINLSDRLILKEALNQENFHSIIKLLKRIFKYTVFFEIIGAIVLSTIFVPQFGFKKG